MSLLALPAELLAWIFDYLPQKDIKNLRLTCRQQLFHAVLRIPRVFLSPNRTNIDVFRSIAQHKQFRQCVEEIIWDDARLPGFISPKHYSVESPDLDCDYGNKFEARKRELWGPGVRPMELDDAFKHYQKLVEQQEEIITTCEDVVTLRLGLRSFPALKRVTITSEAWRYWWLFPLYETPFFRSLPPGFYMPLPWPWHGDPDARLLVNSELFSAGVFLDYDELPSPRIPLHTPWNENRESWRGYFIIAAELLAMRVHHNVRELIIDTNRELTGIGHTLFVEPASPDYNNTLQLFESVPLTRLDLAMNFLSFEQTESSGLRDGLLRTALSKLVNLEHFYLHTSSYMDDRDHYDYRCEELNTILPISSWPRLSFLGLSHLFVHTPSLFDMLAALPSAIRKVELDTIGTNQETGTLHSLLFQLRTDLVDTGRWTRGAPEVILVFDKDVLRRRRVVVSEEVDRFLYDHDDEEFPLIPLDQCDKLVPWDLSRSGIGLLIDNFDPRFYGP